MVVEAPRFLKRPETWRIWVVDSNDAALFNGGSLRVRLFCPGVVAGGRLRVPAGWAVGVQPTANPVKRIMVNVGSAPCAPGCWWQPGKARCRLMGADAEVQPTANPVKRIMVNVGSAPCAPGCWWRPGKARCRLMARGVAESA